jgi:hypothetical protein
MNKQGNALIGDPRAVRLIEATYASLYTLGSPGEREAGSWL